MWRFIEEGPILKFPLRESPFMAADPLYRDVIVAPPIHFDHVSIPSYENQENKSKNLTLTSYTGRDSSASSKSGRSSAGTIENPSPMDGIPSIKNKSRISSGNSHRSYNSASASDVF